MGSIQLIAINTYNKFKANVMINGNKNFYPVSLMVNGAYHFEFENQYFVRKNYLRYWHDGEDRNSLLLDSGKPYKIKGLETDQDGKNFYQEVAGSRPTIQSPFQWLDYDTSTPTVLPHDWEDQNVGVMSYVDDGVDAEYRDDGQDFSDWETNPATGYADYFIYCLHTDGTFSFGFLGLSNNSGKDIDIYTDKALTTRGWNGVADPFNSGKFADSYYVFKSGCFFEKDFTVSAWVRFPPIAP